jgi:hypothetical protein
VGKCGRTIMLYSASIISNLEEMKEQMKEKYLPIDYEQMMFKKMLQLRQASLNMDQYTDRSH